VEEGKEGPVEVSQEINATFDLSVDRVMESSRGMDGGGRVNGTPTNVYLCQGHGREKT
jgi:hypothetical protein